VNTRFRHLLLITLHLLLISAAGHSQEPPSGQDTFHNPLLPTGPDPWVTSHNGFYYYMNTTGRNLTIWKTRDITDLAHAEKKIVWTPPAEGPYSHDIWAPELHFLDGKWYIYFAADGGGNASHRIYVLENKRKIRLMAHGFSKARWRIRRISGQSMPPSLKIVIRNVVGLAASLEAVRLMRDVLYEIKPLDPQVLPQLLQCCSWWRYSHVSFPRGVHRTSIRCKH
jgi:hypothetical protein